MGPRLREWLDEHVPAQRRLEDPDGPLFWNPDARVGGLWSETALRRVWYLACDRAGVARVGVYEGTKHSTATHLKSVGVDDRILASIMGHSDSRSVQRYAKVQGATIRRTLTRLDDE